MSCIYLLIILAFGQTAFVTAKIYPRNVEILEGQGFLAILESYMFVESCQLTRNDKLYSFVPTSNKSYALPTGETFLPLNNKFECGVRVHDTSLLSQGEWKLAAIDASGSLTTDQIEVEVIEHEATCPTDSDQDNHCLLTNMDTLATSNCSTAVYWRNYMCEYSIKGKMTVNTLVERGGEDLLQTGQRMFQEADSTILSCTWDGETAKRIHTINYFNNIKVGGMKMTKCHIEHIPSGKIYKIQDGLQDRRYSAYKTDFGADICQFEIPGDIQDHETGTWKMTIQSTNENELNHGRGYPYRTGDPVVENRVCSFNLKGNETKAQEKLLERIKSTIVVKTVKEGTYIYCAENSYYPLTRCYIRRGDDVLFYYKDERTTDCVFHVGPGNWTCGFNGPTVDDPDFLQNFEVIKYDREIIDEEVKKTGNGTTTLECHHIDQSPIKDCLFLSPSGKMYSLPSDTFKSSEFSYHGGRFRTGDCGIELSKEIEELGKWKCIFRTSAYKPKFDVDILVGSWD